jgi:anaerobic magnesium-protoporphyrin IX monomethyl ester cyclase
MSRVALIFPYFRTNAPTEMLFPPLGMASLSSQLRELGIQSSIFDCTFKTYEQLQKELVAYQPDIIGIYSMITLSHNTFQIAKATRSRFPRALLVAGGPFPTLYPEHYSSHFDVIFRGEVDLSFPRFCQDYLSLRISPLRLEELSLDSYAGLYIHNNSIELSNPTIHYPERVIQSFPLPDRGCFDHTAYQEEWLRSSGLRTTSIITTLGCPFNCDFCSKPVFGNTFRRRNLEQVFTEIEQIRSLGYDNLWIADDNFTLDFSHLRKFCVGLTGRNISWSCLSRTTGIKEETTRLMKSAGCKRVYLGLETGSQATLRLMNKQASLEDGVNAVYKFREAGIEVAAFFIVGYPGETSSSIEETFKFSLSLPLDYISFNVPFPLPGSKLFERVSGIDATKDWSEENEVTFIYSSEFDEQWLRQRIGETMQAFTEKQNKLP